MKRTRKTLIVGTIFLVLVLTGVSRGDGLEAETVEELKLKRMEVAVELQLLQLEGQGIIDRMNQLQTEAQKLKPKIDKLKKEFMDLTDKIKKGQ